MIKKIWNFFTSIKLSIYLGFLLIIFSGIGAFYLQNNAEFFAEIDISVFRLWLIDATRHDFSKVWWIFGILLILIFFAFNTFVCSIEKIITISRFLKKPSIEINPDFIDNLKNNSFFTVEKDMDSVSNKIFTMFKAEKYRTILKPLQDGNILIYGDKGGWSKYAPHLTHMAFLLMLVGHLITSWTGLKVNGFPVFAGQDTAFIPGTNMGIRLNNVNFEYSTDRIKVKNYSADISIFENEKEIRNKEVKVNHPLSYRNNLTFYVLSYGYYQYRYLYIIVNMNQDHGAFTVLIASLFFLIGLYCTLFITYRRFWIVILPSDIPQRSQIKIGGTSDNINFDLEKKMKKFTDKIIKEI